MTKQDLQNHSTFKHPTKYGKTRKSWYHRNPSFHV